jgi:hypothetical protein
MLIWLAGFHTAAALYHHFCGATPLYCQCFRAVTSNAERADAFV